jgi:prophage maintenance system killer protein
MNDFLLAYTPTFDALLAYDTGLDTLLSLPVSDQVFEEEHAFAVVRELKEYVEDQEGATPFFGLARTPNGLSGIISRMHQQFGEMVCYPSVEERAAYLLYSALTEHPFSDGNKRIACALFVSYLRHVGHPAVRNCNAFGQAGLAPLCILIARSEAREQQDMLNLIIHMLHLSSLPE